MMGTVKAHPLNHAPDKCSSPYWEGNEARARGQGSNNPYPALSVDGQNWICGYLDADSRLWNMFNRFPQ